MSASVLRAQTVFAEDVVPHYPCHKLMSFSIEIAMSKLPPGFVPKT